MRNSLHSHKKFVQFAREIHYTDANSCHGRGFCQAGAEDSLLSLGRVAANNSSSLTFFQATSFLFLFFCNWLCRDVRNIYILIHEGEPKDITQAHVCTRFAHMQTKCDIYAGEHLNLSQITINKVKTE